MNTVEICANSLTSALHAQQAGAQRVELCAALSLGGITPSAATIQLVRAALHIDVFVLIRPRGGHFHYSEEEIDVMEKDILFCKNQGCDGVVIGALHPDGTLDIPTLQRLIQAARPMQVTFHRAFDVCKNPMEALHQLIDLSVDRILTSGQQQTAIQGLSFLKKLQEKANNRIKILVGSGVNANNVLSFSGIGINEFHFSAKQLQANPMTFHHKEVQLETSAYQHWISDVEQIKAVIRQFQ